MYQVNVPTKYWSKSRKSAIKINRAARSRGGARTGEEEEPTLKSQINAMPARLS